MAISANAQLEFEAGQLLVPLHALDEAIASDDREALLALSDRLGAQTAELAEAITANTPAV